MRMPADGKPIEGPAGALIELLCIAQESVAADAAADAAAAADRSPMSLSIAKSIEGQAALLLRTVRHTEDVSEELVEAAKQAYNQALELLAKTAYNARPGARGALCSPFGKPTKWNCKVSPVTLDDPEAGGPDRGSSPPSP